MHQTLKDTIKFSNSFRRLYIKRNSFTNRHFHQKRRFHLQKLILCTPTLSGNYGALFDDFFGGITEPTKHIFMLQTLQRVSANLLSKSLDKRLYRDLPIPYSFKWLIVAITLNYGICKHSLETGDLKIAKLWPEKTPWRPWAYRKASLWCTYLVQADNIPAEWPQRH